MASRLEREVPGKYPQPASQAQGESLRLLNPAGLRRNQLKLLLQQEAPFIPYSSLTCGHIQETQAGCSLTKPRLSGTKIPGVGSAAAGLSFVHSQSGRGRVATPTI